MTPSFIPVATAFLLFLAVCFPVYAQVGIKLGDTIESNKISGALPTNRISTKEYIIKEELKQADAHGAIQRKAGNLNKKSQRLEANRATAERIRNKKKKIINSN
jgi:hypothetical protein